MPSRRKRPKKAHLAEVSLGTTVRENLPFPVVYYPNHYGTFFGFAKDEHSPIVLCACSKLPIENLLQLKRNTIESTYSDPLRSAPLDNLFFPRTITDLSMQNELFPLSSVEFREGLCHRCNLITPTLRYCHEMYGTQFIQQYGWYVNQTYLRLGILPLSFQYLTDVCLPEYQRDIHIYRQAVHEYREYAEMFDRETHRLYRDDPKTYWAVREEMLDKRRALERKTRQAERVITKKVEDITRQEFGFRKVGEGWVSENILHQIVNRIFPDQKIFRHARPEWLEGLELDIFLPMLKLAFEYQGQQHFHAIKAWGGEQALQKLRDRDAKKAQLCKQFGIKLIAIDYTEPLTEDHIRKVLQENE